MSKYLRDLKRIAEEQGYVYEGYAGAPGGPGKQRGGPGSGHHVFTDPKSGVVVRAASTPKSESAALKNVRQAMVRNRNTSDSKAQAFRRFLLKKYKIGKNGSKVVDVTIRDLVEEFNQSRPGEPEINSAHVTVMIGQDPMFERLGYQQGGGTRGSSVTTLRISGPAYGLTKEPEEEEATIAEDPCGATFQTSSKGIAVCVLAKGHDGLHFDSFRVVRWAEGSVATTVAVEGPAVIDPVAQQARAGLKQMSEQLAAHAAEELPEMQPAPEMAREPSQTPSPAILEPVSIGGLTLSDELADQLRSALGVPDAAIAAASKDAAIQALVQAQDALTQALAALEQVPSAPTPPSGRGRRRGSTRDDSGIGPIQRNRLDQLAKAVKAGELGPRFTTQEVSALLDISEGATVSTLARGQRDADTVRRIAPSTYELR